MRALILPVVGWAGALQAMAPQTAVALDPAHLLGVASVLGSLTVLVYRLGVWRQEMEHTRRNVGAEVKAHRDESTANFERIERRLDAIDHMVTAASEVGPRVTKWQARTDRRLEHLESLQPE